jgi:hypothetical protein
VFALLSTHFFRRHPDATPLHTSLVLVAIVIALDAFFVAPVLEHSYAMFRSPIGTWIPFASIWLASFTGRRSAAVARLMRARGNSESVLCQNCVTYPPRTPSTHIDLRRHAEAHRCCVKS